AQGNQLPVMSMLVAQSPVPIRAFFAGSFLIGGIKVIGMNALALVAQGKITLNAIVDAGGHGATGGPGATALGACVGMPAIPNDGIGPGPGGGGNATQGAAGGGFQTAGA